MSRPATRIERELEEGVYLLSNGAIITDAGLNSIALRKRWYAELKLDVRALARKIDDERVAHAATRLPLGDAA